MFDAIKCPCAIAEMIESAQWRYSRQVALAIGGKPIEGRYTRTIQTGVVGLDRIYVARIAPKTAKAELERRMRLFRRAGTPFWLIHYDYKNEGESRDWLELEGMRKLFDWRAMAADLSAELPPQARPPKGLEIVEVAGVDLLRVATDITAEAFSLHDTTIKAFRGMTSAAKAPGSPFGIVQFIGCVDGEPLGSATMLADEGTVGIYWVGTLEKGRRRGLAEALVRHIMDRGRAEGCKYAALQATALGQPLYERLGFVDSCPIHVWGWAPE